MSDDVGRLTGRFRGDRTRPRAEDVSATQLRGAARAQSDVCRSAFADAIIDVDGSESTLGCSLLPPARGER